jgi:hypothetical protein
MENILLYTKFEISFGLSSIYQSDADLLIPALKFPSGVAALGFCYSLEELSVEFDALDTQKLRKFIRVV